MEASTRDYKCKKKGRKGDRDSNYKGWEKEKSSEYPLEDVLQEVGTKNRPGAGTPGAQISDFGRGKGVATQSLEAICIDFSAAKKKGKK